MESRSTVLAELNTDQRRALEARLLQRQSGKCFICNKDIDLVLHAGQLDIDHIDPLVNDGPDDENNFAITHASCNRSKGASDLRVARRMAEFDELQERLANQVLEEQILGICSAVTEGRNQI